MRKVVAEAVTPVGWPKVAETLDKLAARHIPIYACGACSRARGVTEADLSNLRSKVRKSHNLCFSRGVGRQSDYRIAAGSSAISPGPEWAKAASLCWTCPIAQLSSRPETSAQRSSPCTQDAKDAYAAYNALLGGPRPGGGGGTSRGSISIEGQTVFERRCFDPAIQHDPRHPAFSTTLCPKLLADSYSAPVAWSCSALDKFLDNFLLTLLKPTV
jgi:hypothetical protein